MLRCFICLAAVLLVVPGPAFTENAPVHLAGSAWHLVRFQSSDGKAVTPDDESKYTIAFLADGTVSVRIDCNRGRRF